ncbi:MAG TPA: NADH-quinone oxidoreductase subunit NuoI [Nitrospirota bacterium]|nr:NADH-quinone oxidoreductase subunit NuoI [Nitrospirota bacterium]
MSKVKKILRTIFLIEIAEGMWLTLHTMLTRQKNMKQYAMTRQYPTFKRKAIPGSRGLHAMRRDDTGEKERCIGCGLCEAVCPSQCIKVVTSEGHEHEKLVNSYELDLLRCVFCGFCIDACPVSAILMTPEFELACYQRKDAFYTKDRLVEVGDRYLGGKAVKKP